MDPTNTEGERLKQTPTEASKGFLRGLAERVNRFLTNDLTMMTSTTISSGILGVSTGLNYAYGNTELAVISGLATGMMAISSFSKGRSMILEIRDIKKQVSNLQDNQKPKVNE